MPVLKLRIAVRLAVAALLTGACSCASHGLDEAEMDGGANARANSSTDAGVSPASDATASGEAAVGADAALLAYSDAASAPDGNLGSAPLDAGFVHTDGTRIVDADGNALYLHGINLGNWLVWEGYLLLGDTAYRTHSQLLAALSSAFGSSERAAAFEHQWRLSYVDDSAIAAIAALGFNAVRLPFNYKLFYQNGALSEAGFAYIDRAIEACRAHGVYVLLDMHGAPGYQNPGDHSDNINSNASQPRASVGFWDGDNVSIAANVWRHIAQHYAHEPMVWGYDLVNEPVPQAGREYELLPSYVALAQAIREVDANHLIVAEGSYWGSDLTKLDWQDATVQSRSKVRTQWDSKLVYEIHHYGPVAGTVGREAISNRLGIPLIIGEYGETDDTNLAAIHTWARSALAGDFPWTFKKVIRDKALWTVPTDANWDKLRDAVVNGAMPPASLYDSALGFARDSVKNTHPSLVWNSSFYAGIKP